MRPVLFQGIRGVTGPGEGAGGVGAVVVLGSWCSSFGGVAVPGLGVSFGKIG